MIVKKNVVLFHEAQLSRTDEGDLRTIVNDYRCVGDADSNYLSA